MTSLNGARAVITGASSGIGLATARLLRSRGADLHLVARDPDRLNAVAAGLGGRAIAVDLADPDATERAGEWLAELQPDLLVNCAGIGLLRPAERTAPAELRRLLEVNVVAAATLTSAVLPGMLERGSGHLVFVSSIAGRLGVGQEPAYSATKAALDVYASSLCSALRPHGIRVTTVVPGAVDTGFFARRGVPYSRRFPRPVSPDLVASRLVDAVEQDRTEVVVPRWLTAALWVRTAAPGVYAAAAARWS